MLSQSELVINPKATDEVRIPLDSTSTVQIDPGTGNLTVSSADTSNIGSDAQVTVSAFTLDPATVEQGQSFSTSLQSVGAWECRRTGLPDAQWERAWTSPPPDGGVSVKVNTEIAPDTYTLAYECRNGGTPTQQTAQLEVVQATQSEPDASLPAECSDVALPDNWSRDTKAIAQSLSFTETWIDFFDLAFPAGVAENLAIQEDEYLALEFDPRNLPAGAEGGLTFDKFTGGVNLEKTGNGSPTITISRCPGDFGPQEDARCRRVDKTNLDWSTDPADSIACTLDTSVSRYFLNVVYANEREEDDPSTWTYSCWNPDTRSHFPECGSLLSTFSN